MALCIVRPFVVLKRRIQITMSAMVLLRVWILRGRTRKITIALMVVLILYLCACITVLVYIMGAIECRSTHTAKIADVLTVVSSQAEHRFHRDVWGGVGP